MALEHARECGVCAGVYALKQTTCPPQPAVFTEEVAVVRERELEGESIVMCVLSSTHICVCGFCVCVSLMKCDPCLMLLTMQLLSEMHNNN